MSKIAAFMSSSGGLAVGAGAITVVGALAYSLGVFSPAPVPEPMTQEAVAVVAEPAPEAAEVAPQLEPKLILPTIGNWRVDGEGNSVIAGFAAPNTTVVVMVDGAEVARAISLADGSYTSLFSLPFSEAPREMTVRAEPKDGVAVAAAESFVIAPIPAPEPQVVEAAEPQPQAPPAPAVIKTTSSGVEVIQPAISDQAPEVMSTVALDAISYSDAGEVQLAGRALGEGFVRVYLDNRAITTSRIAADGKWRSDLPDVDTGIYTLRVDEVDASGEVTSRVETPFKRESTETIAAANERATTSAPAAKRVEVVTVQPGATLWALARDQYGEGKLYVQLFEANKDRIRNPDLIFPGQVFDIPQ